jgi:hypothetical protein
MRILLMALLGFYDFGINSVALKQGPNNYKDTKP